MQDTADRLASVLERDARAVGAWSRDRRHRLALVAVLGYLGFLLVYGLARTLAGHSDYHWLHQFGRTFVDDRLDPCQVYANCSYPGFLFVWVTPFSRLPMALGFICWYVQLVLCWFAAVSLSLDTARRLGAGLSGPVAWLPALLAVPWLTDNLFLGQTNLLVLASLAAMLALEVRGRPTAAGLWLGLAVALKVTPVLFVVRALVLGRPRQAVVAVLTAALLTVGAPALLVGPRQAVDMARSFVNELTPMAHGGQVANRNVDWRYTNQSLEAMLHRALTDYGRESTGRRPYWALSESLSHDTVRKIALGLRLLVLAGLAWLTGRTRARSMARFAEPGLWVLVMLFLSPLSWVNHYVVALPAYAGLVACLGRPGWPRRADRLWRVGYLLTVLGWMRWFQHLSAVLVGHLLIAAALVVCCWSQAEPQPQQHAEAG